MSTYCKVLLFKFINHTRVTNNQTSNRN